MKRKHNAGFSLIEILVAIVLLGAIAVPTCTSLVMSVRMNARTEDMMQAQLAVSSAVETLMAEGITGPSDEYDFSEVEIDGTKVEVDQFPDVEIMTDGTAGDPYYTVTVTSNDDLVSVTTYIRAAGTEGGEGS